MIWSGKGPRYADVVIIGGGAKKKLVKRVESIRVVEGWWLGLINILTKNQLQQK
jgi:hypothetical protein